MRKFVEPEMKVMAVNMKENIAHSGLGTSLGGGNNNAAYCTRSDETVVDTGFPGSHYKGNPKNFPELVGCLYSENH